MGDSMETDVLLKFLCNKLDSNEGLPWLTGYSGSFREDTSPEGTITIKQVGGWLWLSVELYMEGTTMDQTTDRLGGDPYEAEVRYDWIGPADTAPEKVSHPNELDEWAKLKTSYVRENNDSGYWGSHNGKWVDAFLEDGTVTLCVASGRYQDVPPESTTTIEEVKLEP